jgi:hypothetical protein
LVDVTMEPRSSMATHSEAGVVVHDTAYNEFVPSAWVTVQAEDPPVGFVEVTTSPVSSTATHNAAGVVAHDTP